MGNAMGGDLKAIRSFCMAAALTATLGTSSAHAQGLMGGAREQTQEEPVRFGLDDASLLTQDSQQRGTTLDGKSSVPDAPTPAVSPDIQPNPIDQYGKQPKRILWIIPNYRAVSANTQLPPLNFKEELWLATQDTFDYSDFIFVGGLAGIAMAGNSQPSFGQGAEGFGKYYWHVFVDGAI